MRFTSLMQWWIGFGSSRRMPPYSYRELVPAEGTLSRPTGQLWPSGLISWPERISAGSPSGAAVFAEILMPAGASRGTASGCGRHSGLGRLDVNRDDPVVELALAVDLQKAAISHVAGSSCNTYTGQWNMFVAWCDVVEVPRVTLPAADATLALYLQSAANRAKTSAPVKAASAAIAFYQKINLFDHEPTHSPPAVYIVRSVATRQFGLNNKNMKKPFEWAQEMKFAEAYGVRQQAYCHLVVVAMSVIMFGAICRYDDASGLLCSGTSASRRTGAPSRLPSTSARTRSSTKGGRYWLPLSLPLQLARCGSCNGCGFKPAERRNSMSSADSTAC